VAYQVIKTIKGKKYLYQQESYRDGGKVRSRCVCLGPINPVTGELHAQDQVQQAVRKTVSDVIEATEENDAILPPSEAEQDSSFPQSVNTTNETPKVSLHEHSERLLQLKSKVEKKNLTRRGFSLAHRTMLTRLRERGLDLDRVPSVVVKDGFKANWSHQKSRNRVVVTIERGNQNRAQIRREVFRGYGRAMIETMRDQQPEEFAKLTLQMEKSFVRSQKLISRFVMLGRDRKKFAKTLSLRFWGNVLQLDKNLLMPKHGRLTKRLNGSSIRPLDSSPKEPKPNDTSNAPNSALPPNKNSSIKYDLWKKYFSNRQI